MISIDNASGVNASNLIVSFPPLFQQMLDWGQKSLDSAAVEQNSNLGGAISYLLKHQAGLGMFLRVPGAKLDNSLMEQALKLIVLGRKNHLFFKTEAGAAIGDVITSVCATVKKAEINLFDYLTDIQRHSDLVRKNPENWVPWNYERTIAQIEAKKVA